MSKTIYFSVTTDLVTDQRMIRICHSLEKQGYSVLLIGRMSSTALPNRPFDQIRLNCRAKKGKWMYLEYNCRLFFFLMTAKKPEVLVSIDLDTILPVYLTSKLRSVKRVYDAHEWFSEMKEVITRPVIKTIWTWVEKTYVPKFPNGYTVSYSIAESFKKLYQVSYEVIMNASVLHENESCLPSTPPYLIYQGAVNEGRCLEWLIPAMKNVPMELWIFGDGNYREQCIRLINENGLSEKVIMKGTVSPEALHVITRKAYAGINLVEPFGKNQLMSLANKFFDYFHAGIPQLTMNFPEYKNINEKYTVALLIDRPDPELIAMQLNKLIQNKVLYEGLISNCKKAANTYNWQEEEKKLLRFYKKLFNEK